MDEEFKITDNRVISLSRIPSDVHRLGLPQEITRLLIDNGVFFISQIEQMTVYALSQLTGINSITAESIKRSFYRYRWRADHNGKIQNIEEIKLLIETSPQKKEILKTRIEELFINNNIYSAFRSMKLRTIEDILNLNTFDIFRIQGIGLIRYNEILDSIAKLMASMGEDYIDTFNFPKEELFDCNWFTKAQLTFPEVFTILLNIFSPRNRAIFYDYFFTYRAQFGAYTEIAAKHDLTRERIRQICEKGLRVLRHTRRINCITTYLNTVWKVNVHNFVIVNGGYVTRSELEQKFADDIPEIYFLQDKILRTADIWADVLVKNQEYYYLPFLPGEKVDRIEQAISKEIKKYEWGIDIGKLTEIIDSQLTLSQFLGDRSKDVIVGIIKKFDLLEIEGDEVRLAMRRKP